MGDLMVGLSGLEPPNLALISIEVVGLRLEIQGL
jgi:hypothetical protein